MRLQVTGARELGRVDAPPPAPRDRTTTDLRDALAARDAAEGLTEFESLRPEELIHDAEAVRVQMLDLALLCSSGRLATPSGFGAYLPVIASESDSEAHGEGDGAGNESDVVFLRGDVAVVSGDDQRVRETRLPTCAPFAPVRVVGVSERRLDRDELQPDSIGLADDSALRARHGSQMRAVDLVPVDSIDRLFQTRVPGDVVQRTMVRAVGLGLPDLPREEQTRILKLVAALPFAPSLADRSALAEVRSVREPERRAMQDASDGERAKEERLISETFARARDGIASFLEATDTDESSDPVVRCRARSARDLAAALSSSSDMHWKGALSDGRARDFTSVGAAKGARYAFAVGVTAIDATYEAMDMEDTVREDGRELELASDVAADETTDAVSGLTPSQTLALAIARESVSALGFAVPRDRVLAAAASGIEDVTSASRRFESRLDAIRHDWLARGKTAVHAEVIARERAIAEIVLSNVSALVEAVGYHILVAMLKASRAMGRLAITRLNQRYRDTFSVSGNRPLGPEPPSVVAYAARALRDIRAIPGPGVQVAWTGSVESTANLLAERARKDRGVSGAGLGRLDDGTMGSAEDIFERVVRRQAPPPDAVSAALRSAREVSARPIEDRAEASVREPAHRPIVECEAVWSRGPYREWTSPDDRVDDVLEDVPTPETNVGDGPNADTPGAFANLMRTAWFPAPIVHTIAPTVCVFMTCETLPDWAVKLVQANAGLAGKVNDLRRDTLRRGVPSQAGPILSPASRARAGGTSSGRSDAALAASFVAEAMDRSSHAHAVISELIRISSSSRVPEPSNKESAGCPLKTDVHRRAPVSTEPRAEVAEFERDVGGDATETTAEDGRRTTDDLDTQGYDTRDRGDEDEGDNS